MNIIIIHKPNNNKINNKNYKSYFSKENKEIVSAKCKYKFFKTNYSFLQNQYYFAKVNYLYSTGIHDISRIILSPGIFDCNTKG